MTEFRRASASVEAVERHVTALADEALVPEDEAQRDRFIQARKLFEELEPAVEKMRRKCQARADLEAAKDELRQKVPGSPEDVLKVAQELTEAGDASAKDFQSLLDRTLVLDGAATYGATMVEKVLGLLSRYDAAQSRFNTEIMPRLGAAVDAAVSEDAERHAREQREAENAAAIAAKQAEEELRRPVAALLAANEEAERRQREEAEAIERKAKAVEEAERLAEALLAEELEALRQAEVEGEKRLKEVGPEVACGEALATLLALPVGTFRTAVEALRDMIAAVAAEPEDARARVVRLSNARFQEALGRRQGAWLFLRGVGFVPRDRPTLPVGLIAVLGLGALPPEERFFLLESPNIAESFECWKEWYERLKGVAAFLDDLGRLTFQRTAHLGTHGLDVAAHTVISDNEVLQRWKSRPGV